MHGAAYWAPSLVVDIAAAPEAYFAAVKQSTPLSHQRRKSTVEYVSGAGGVNSCDLHRVGYARMFLLMVDKAAQFAQGNNY